MESGGSSGSNRTRIVVSYCIAGTRSAGAVLTTGSKLISLIRGLADSAPNPRDPIESSATTGRAIVQGLPAVVVSRERTMAIPPFPRAALATRRRGSRNLLLKPAASVPRDEPDRNAQEHREPLDRGQRRA